MWTKVPTSFALLMLALVHVCITTKVAVGYFPQHQEIKRKKKKSRDISQIPAHQTEYRACHIHTLIGRSRHGSLIDLSPP
ncbi:hypothetical protein DER44DRAFT_399427 [Fusarium oxysporum]|nr:hypothetical protein DER44DRAFT_399427 [Fusarium oxysporum]